jgi:O-methyltransferase involved in polyketide biosynthesis
LIYHDVIHDPPAALLAGETYLRNLHEKMRKEQTNNAHQTSGVILAVRMLTFDSRLDLKSPSGKEIQILLGAGL